MNAQKLKGHRVGLGLYQGEVAKALGMTNKTYNHKENGKVEFKLSEVANAAEVMRMTLHQVNEIFFDNKLTERISS